MNNSKLAQEWKKLEHSTLYYRKLLERQPLEVLRWKPQPQGWSLLEIMEHLAGAEGAALKYLERREYKPLQSRSKLPQVLRALLLRLALRSALKFKAPEISGLSPTNSTAPQQLLLEWRSVRQGYFEYLEQLPPELAGETLFLHPRAGGLNLTQMLQFMRDHLQHHRRQAELILRQQPHL